jgi:hypothetical protein
MPGRETTFSPAFLANAARLRLFRPVVLVLALLASTGAACAADFFRTNDVIAFVGGEDVVAMQQHGYVEVLLARETVARNLRFRNLGWEGDTVFEQRRDLNFPTWEQTLAKIGATVVVAQFGQAESLRGRGTLPAFRGAAEPFLARLAGAGRRLIVLSPVPFENAGPGLPDLRPRNEDLAVFVDALEELSRARGWAFVDVRAPLRRAKSVTRDGLHLNAAGHWLLAQEFARELTGTKPLRIRRHPDSRELSPPAAETLRQAIVGKNQLWFDYWRPQNWAFLAGDRTEQPSSRDHRNPKVRWFPNEMELFPPLIEKREAEIKAQAGKLP